MEDIKVLKHQLEVCFRSNAGFKEEAPRVLRIIRQSSESYIQFFFKSISEVLTSPTATPSTKFYSLLTLIKASELKNYSFYHFLVKECDLLNYIYRSAGYDLNPKSVATVKGTHFFSKHPNPTEMVLGFNVVRICQELIVDWYHLCKDFKPRKYFEIFKFLLGRIRKIVVLEKPFFFISKQFDLRQDIATCNFQRTRPYLIPRHSTRNLMKAPDSAKTIETKTEEIPEISDQSLNEMEEFGDEDAIILSHNNVGGQDTISRSCILDELRKQYKSGTPSMNQITTNEKEESEPQEGLEDMTFQPENGQGSNPTLLDPENIVIENGEEEQLAEEPKEEEQDQDQEEQVHTEQDMLEAKKTESDVNKELLVRTVPASPNKKPGLAFLQRAGSGEHHRITAKGGNVARNMRLELLNIKHSITKSQTISRKNTMNSSQVSTPQKEKEILFDFDQNTSHNDSDDGIKAEKSHKRVQSQGNGQPAIMLTSAVIAEANSSQRRGSGSWQFATPPPPIGYPNVLVQSKGGLAQEIQKGIRKTNTIGGKPSGNRIIVFADEGETEENAQNYKQENELLKEKLKEYEQLIKMLGGKVDGFALENLKKAMPCF